MQTLGVKGILVLTASRAGIDGGRPHRFAASRALVLADARTDFLKTVCSLWWLSVAARVKKEVGVGRGGRDSPRGVCVWGGGAGGAGKRGVERRGRVRAAQDRTGQDSKASFVPWSPCQIFDLTASGSGKTV